MSSTFVHLHVHTEYSLVDSILRIQSLVEQVRADAMPAVAVTEQSNLFSVVKFYRAALGAGVKPIIGADVWVQSDHEQPHRLVLLCQNAQGYRHLARLVSRSYTEGQSHGLPVLNGEWFEDASDGLIALSGGSVGDVGQALLSGRTSEAERHLRRWVRLFPDRYYVQLTRTGREGEEEHIDAALELAQAKDLPVVAANDVRFMRPEDFEAHEARVCIHEGRTLADPRRARRYTDQQYLRTPAEMAELFSDIPEALENSVEIARRCNLELRLGESALPDFPVQDARTLEECFVEESWRGLDARLKQGASAEAEPDDRRNVYAQRLRTELDVITRMGYAGYFLIVADFIQWAREHGVPVGPGRGSGAGSLAAYALGITDLDPMRYDLLFERFLNPERVSLPDFDVDFCMAGRDRVIEYVADKYGRDRVSQIITFGTMAARAVVRDVGRVLGHSYGYVDQIAKLIPFDLGITLDKALSEEDLLRKRYEEDDDVRTLMDLAQKLEGLARNAGRHAGGVVIAPSALTDFTPLYCEPGADSTVTQLDKDDVESVGLVKFDFLGLRTLTIVDWAVRSINEERARSGEPPFDVGSIPLDDQKTYALIKRGATTAVFQLESRGMKDLIRRLEPDCFEDVIALVALFRPGPLQSGMVDDFIDRKHGRARIAYLHPDLETILKPTYGVILYQEQVMQIAQVLAGYSLGEADLLRRAMGKKKPEEMAKQRSVFIEGARGQGVGEDRASHIFDLMEKFAGYGFNKSHSAAYALIAYQTAWLKAHHPAAFMAAVLSADMDHTDKVVGFINECRDLGLTVRSPDVNRCEYTFSVEDARTIRYGLGAIKGVGHSAIEEIISERESGGAFKDLFDFCRRVDTRKVNRRALEALIRAGTLDDLGPSRAAMMVTLTQALQAGEQHARDRTTGQNDLFGGPVMKQAPQHIFAHAPEWSEEERLAGEKETLGLYLTGHPITRFEDELARFTSGRLANLRPLSGRSQLVAGFVVNLRTANSRTGRRAVLTLDDRTAQIEANMYPEVYQRCRDMLAKDALLIAEVEVSDDRTGETWTRVQQVYDIARARETFGKRLTIQLESSQMSNGFIDQLKRLLSPFREGEMPVCIHYQRPDAVAPIHLDATWRVKPAEDLLQRLRELAGSDRVAVEY